MAHPLQALRDVMAEYHIDAYLIPTADFHGSEYVGAHFACREYLSGFTGSGYPKALPEALAAEIKAAHDKGDDFQIASYTGASTAPEHDGALAAVDGISMRMPYQSDPVMRTKINAGVSEYSDVHLSHSGPQVRHGFWGNLDAAVIEVTKINEDGTAVPSSE